MKISKKFSIFSFLLTGFLSAALYADEKNQDKLPVLVIKNHRFTPTTLTVPANKRFQIRVKNEDPSSEEFESKLMIIEKIIPGNTSMDLYLGPLLPGTYDFKGDFHDKTANGQIIAVDESVKKSEPEKK